MEHEHKPSSENTTQNNVPKIKLDLDKLMTKPIEHEREPMEHKREPFNIKGIFVSLAFSALTVIIFYVVFFLVALISTFIFGFLLSIPIVNKLVELFFVSRGDSPTMLITFLCVMISYAAANGIIQHIVQNARKLTLLFTGIHLVWLNVVFMMINLANDASIIGNIVITIVGIVFIYKGKTFESE